MHFSVHRIDLIMKNRFVFLPIGILSFFCFWSWGQAKDSAGENKVRQSVVVQEKKAKSIFDGKSFQGWEGGDREYFRIQDGAIVGGSLKKEVPRNEFLCTETNYDNFELTLKVRTKGTVIEEFEYDGEVIKDFLFINAGIQFRSKRIPNTNEVSGYQADIGVSLEGNVWGSLYDESRRRTMLQLADQNVIAKAMPKGKSSEEWQDYKILCDGDHIQIWVNDVKTIDYREKDETITKSGVICLQIHEGPAQEAWYKDIVIKETR